MPRLPRPWFFALLPFLLGLLAGSAAAAPDVGEPVPAFEAKLLSGQVVRSAQYRQRPLLVVFWASWCPPCKGEMAELQKLYERHRGRGLEILAISMDDDRKDIDDFLRAQPVSFPVARENDRHGEIFGPFLMPPRLFLIGRDGRLRLAQWGAIKADALEAAIRAAF
ncbi:MAG: TlpA family protein disulfide reductase [Rhodocyclaceae bacterium]|nr:TlpA family protein disulfide reductase [Rhodocyclaceae bacterium]